MFAPGARRHSFAAARLLFVIMPEKNLEFFEKSIFFSFLLWYDDK